MAGFPILRSRRVRATPYSERVEAAPLSGYSVYNHMLIAAAFQSMEEDCAHLKQHVQLWDVACERQLEISGPDAHRLATLMSARNLNSASPGRCYYAPITDGNGGMLNDPIALCLSPTRFWFSLADSDLLLWALGLAEGMNLNVQIHEPDVSPLAIQGAKAEDLAVRVFGEGLRELKFFRFAYFPFMGQDLLIARSGWSHQGGFEIYLHDSTLALPLWDAIWDAGQDLNIRVGCPNLIERIEAGLLSYGNDMTRNDTPLECSLERFCNLDSDHAFIGKEALLRQRDQGLRRRLMGVKIADAVIPSISATLACRFAEDGEGTRTSAGYVSSATYSPDNACTIGFAMLAIEATTPGTEIEVIHNNTAYKARVCSLPFDKNN
ncbi:MAG: dimethylsulfoniopropionate demethylase [Alphaproteobacteria bacterium]